jgi:P-type conjugative transfer protein TrbJ
MAPAPAYAIYCSNCSTFYQQMYEYAEAVNATEHRAAVADADPAVRQHD